MKISFISDTHIVHDGDRRNQALKKFYRHPLVNDSDYIIFGGDIFDYASGFHPEYFNRFKSFFDAIKRFLNEGKQVVFIEGNHDIHLKRNFDEFFNQNALNKNNFEYSQTYFEIKDKKNHLYFTHGDELPGTPEKYIQYKNLIRSRPLQIAANLMPLKLFDYLASNASKNSRGRSSQYEENETLDSFREAAMNIETEANIVITGHSHLLDEYKHKKRAYFNNGFSPKTGKFVYYAAGKTSLKDYND